MKKLVFLLLCGLLMGCPEAVEPEVTVTIRFDANGGTGEMANVTVVKDREITLPQVAFSRENFIFISWNDKKDGSGRAFGDKTKIKPDADLTLYAQWSDSAIRLNFDANGGTGEMDAKTGEIGSLVYLPDAQFTPPTGKRFAGWMETAKYSEGTTVYEAGSEYRLMYGKETLYACWMDLYHFPEMTSETMTHTPDTRSLKLIFSTTGELPSDLTYTILLNDSVVTPTILVFDRTSENQYSVYLQYEESVMPYGVWAVQLSHADYAEITPVSWTLEAPGQLPALSNLKATAADSSVTFSWDSPAEGVTFSQVQVTYREPGAGQDTVVKCDVNGTQCVLAGLINGTDYSFSVAALNQGYPGETGTVTATLERYYNNIVRGEKNLTLVKLFDFKDSHETQTIQNGCNATNEAYKTQVSFDNSGNGYLQFVLNASQNRITGNVIYPLAVGGGSSGIVYAEMAYTLDKPSSVFGIGLGSGNVDAQRGWKTMFLYSPSSGESWQIRNNMAKTAYSKIPQANQTVTIGIDFSTANNRSFYQNGLFIKTLTDGSADALSGLNQYWLFFNNEKPVPEQVTLKIDYIAFYKATANQP